MAIAEELLQGLGTEEADYTMKDVLPSHETWEAAMAPFLQLPTRPSTAITSPLGGLIHLVNSELSDSFKAMRLAIPRDTAHCSVAFRVASFAIKLLSSSHVINKVDREDLETLFYYLPLAIQVIDDDLSIENCNGITGLELAHQREEYLDIVYKGRQVVSDWIHTQEPVKSSQGASVSSSLISLWEAKLEALNGTSPIDYRVGEAFVKIMSSTGASENAKSADDVAGICREARSANAIRSASWFAVLRSAILANPVGNRICNELIADSTGLKPQETSPDGQSENLARRSLFTNITNII